ncbi:hypothetical protein D9M68_643160 [compost metagenome]
MTMIINPFVYVSSGGDGYPEFKALAKSQFGGASTSGTLTLPSYAVGDLLILSINYHATGATLTLPSGWTLLASTTASTATRHSIYYKVADGTEGSSLSITFSVVASFACIIASLKSGTFAFPVVIQAAQFVTTVTVESPPDPPSLSPSSGSAKYMVIASYGAKSDCSPTAYPYSGGDYIANSGIGGSTGTRETVAICFGTFNASSVDPSPFAVSTTGTRWAISNTISIRGG